MTALLYAKTHTYVVKRKQFVLSTRVVLDCVTIVFFSGDLQQNEE
jgi:hypothetical protein